MKNRSHIQEELQQISPLIAQLPTGSPYQVPEGYFEQLPELLLQRAAKMEAGDSLPPVLEKRTSMPFDVPAGYFDSLPQQLLDRVKKNSQSPTLPEKAPATPFSVPAGYFEQLPQQLLQRVKTLDTENERPAFLPADRINPYQVPAGYFDSLPQQLLQRVRATEAGSPEEELASLSPLLSSLSKKTPYTAPEGYFDSVEEDTVAGAKAIEFVNENLENLPPVLAGLQHKNVYEAPAGYFEQLPGQLLQQMTVTQQPARVVSMSFTKRVVRFAVAAALVAAMFTIGINYLNRGTGPDGVTPDQPAVAQVTTDSDLNEIAAEMDGLSDTALQNYLNSETVALAGTVNTVTSETGDAQMDESDLKVMLADVSDAELEQYLKQQYAYPKTVTN